MVFGRRFLYFGIPSHDYTFRRQTQKRGMFDCRRMCNITNFPDVSGRDYWLIVSMFRAVVEITILSILKSSATIEREEKLLIATSFVIIGSIVSFYSVKTI